MGDRSACQSGPDVVDRRLFVAPRHREERLVPSAVRRGFLVPEYQVIKEFWRVWFFGIWFCLGCDSVRGVI